MATGLEQQLIKGARFAAGPVVPIGSIAAAGFEKGQKKVKAEQLAKQKADFERRKLEAENYNKKRKDSEKILSDYIKTEEDYSGGVLPGNVGEIITNESIDLKKFHNNVENQIRKGNIGLADSMKARQQSQQMLKKLNSGAGTYKEWMKIYEQTHDNLSSTVGSKNVDIVNSMAKGLVFKQGKNAIVKNEKGETIYTFEDKEPIDVYGPEAFEELNYISPDTSGINALFDATQKSAQSAASKGADMTGYIKKVEQDLAQLTLTDNQYISAAFDFLGKETPGFTNPFKSYIEEDMRAAFESKDPSLIKDKGGEEGNVDEIKAFVHKAMIEGAKDAYEGYKKDYADKFEPKSDPKPTSAEQSKIEMKESAEKQVQNFFKNKSVWLRTKFGPNFEMEDTVVEFEDNKYDLNRKEDIIRLIRNHGTAPGGIKGAEFDMAVQDAVNERRAKRLSIDEFN